MTDLVVLYPRDVLQPRLADDHYRDEHAAVQAAGVEVALLDHDALLTGDILGALRGFKPQGTRIAYRGWMIPPRCYRSWRRPLSHEA